MSCFKVSESVDPGVTIIYNEFLDEYMGQANEIQLKVYLYLMRVLRVGKPTSVADIAEKFNFTDREVKKALSYWEKEGLLEVKKDRSRSVEGIRMLTPWYSATDAVYVEEEEEKREVKPEKPAKKVKQEESAAAGEDEDTAQILYLAEVYLGRPLTSTDTRSIIFISSELHFSPELADYLIQYCVQGGHKDMRYIEKTAIAWAERGVETASQAKLQVAPMDSSVYDVMNALGKSSKPTRAEIAFIEKWKDTYGFDLDMIMEACRKTVLATDSHRFNYADGILSKWHLEGFSSLSDVEKAEIDRKGQRIRAVRQGQGARKRTQSSSMRGDYDTGEIEKTLLSNGNY
ncbi:MAG: DnaD domain protein [Lachnospiraceae bacterium]|nr:DnaD domain protein [Lachnospiraceae bacterium]